MRKHSQLPSPYDIKRRKPLAHKTRILEHRLRYDLRFVADSIITHLSRQDWIYTACLYAPRHGQAREQGET